MQVTLQYATEHLNELAGAADNGEDVEIARPEKPLLKLTASEFFSIASTIVVAMRPALRCASPKPSLAHMNKVFEEDV